MTYVKTPDGTDLYLKDWGQGRPVVLIHGWPLSADTWDDTAMTLVNAGFRVLAYDRRGFGRSSQPWGGYDYDTLADDLAAVLDHAGAYDAALVGFSMGGGEVARYMSRHGGRRVSQTALIASIVPYMLKCADNPHGTAQDEFDQIAAGIAHDRASFFASFFKLFFGVGVISHPVSTEVLQWAWTQSMQASLRATLECANAFAHTDFRSELEAFRVPTLIVHGTDDKIVPIDASSRAAAIAIKSSRLLEYSGAPHGLFATEKLRLAEDLVDFLRHVDDGHVQVPPRQVSTAPDKVYAVS